MGLVQNLKMILSESGKIILQGLLSHYIKQRAKQTSKKQDNSSSTTFSQNPLTAESLPGTIVTSSTGTSEKTTSMELLEQTCASVAEYYIDRIHVLCERGMYDDAAAMNEELKEWIHSQGQHEVYSLPTIQ